MRTKVQKWGNSLALRIPKSFATETSLEPNTEVELSLLDGKLVIAPVVDTEYRLDDLLAKITPENIHAEVDTGASAGNESW